MGRQKHRSTSRSRSHSDRGVSHKERSHSKQDSSATDTHSHNRSNTKEHTKHNHSKGFERERESNRAHRGSSTGSESDSNSTQHSFLSYQRGSEHYPASDLESMCSKISSIANSYNSLPAKPPKSPWRFAIRKATVVLNVESSTETEFITKFEMMKEAESVMVQEPADVSGTEFKVRTYIIQLAEFMRELPKPYATSLCFTRTFPDEHEFMGSVKDIKSGKVSASLQIHPHPSEDVLTGTLYLVHTARHREESNDEEFKKSHSRERKEFKPRHSNSRGKSLERGRKQSRDGGSEEKGKSKSKDSKTKGEKRSKSRGASHDHNNVKKPGHSHESEKKRRPRSNSRGRRGSHSEYMHPSSRERSMESGRSRPRSHSEKEREHSGKTHSKSRESSRSTVEQHEYESESEKYFKRKHRPRSNVSDEYRKASTECKHSRARSQDSDSESDSHGKGTCGNLLSRNDSPSRIKNSKPHGHSRKNHSSDLESNKTTKRSKSRDSNHYHSNTKHLSLSESDSERQSRSHSRKSDRDETHTSRSKSRKDSRENGRHHDPDRSHDRSRSRHDNLKKETRDNGSHSDSSIHRHSKRRKEINSISDTKSRDSSGDRDSGDLRKMVGQSNKKEKSNHTKSRERSKGSGKKKHEPDYNSDDGRQRQQRSHDSEHQYRKQKLHKRSKSDVSEVSGSDSKAHKDRRRRTKSHEPKHRSGSVEPEESHSKQNRGRSQESKSGNHGKRGDSHRSISINSHTVSVQADSDTSYEAVIFVRSRNTSHQPHSKQDNNGQWTSEKSHKNENCLHFSGSDSESQDSDVEVHNGKPHDRKREKSGDRHTSEQRGRNTSNDKHHKERHSSSRDRCDDYSKCSRHSGKQHDRQTSHHHKKLGEKHRPAEKSRSQSKDRYRDKNHTPSPLENDCQSRKCDKQQKHSNHHKRHESSNRIKGSKLKENRKHSTSSNESESSRRSRSSTKSRADPPSDSDSLAHHTKRSHHMSRHSKPREHQDGSNEHSWVKTSAIHVHELDRYFIFTNPRMNYKVPENDSESGDSHVEKKVSFRRDSQNSKYSYSENSSESEPSRSETMSSVDSYCSSELQTTTSQSFSSSDYDSSDSLKCKCDRGLGFTQERYINQKLKEYEVSRKSDSYGSTSEGSYDDGSTSSTGYAASSDQGNQSGLSTPRASDHPPQKRGFHDKSHQDATVIKSIQRLQDANPGSGEIILPLNQAPKPGELPPEELLLDFIHGYRTRDVTNNAFYLSEDTVVFPAGSVGIVMNLKSSNQRFFQGRHKQEISCLAVHPSRKLIATGDVVSHHSDGCFLYVWDPKEPEDIQRMVQIRVGDRRLSGGVADICFSPCGKYLAAVTMDDRHHVYVYNWQKAGKLIAKEAGHKHVIFGILFNPTSSQEFLTFGAMHLTFSKLDLQSGNISSKPGVFGSEETPSILSAAYLPNALLATGTHKGNILLWEKGQVIKVLDGVHQGPIFSIKASAKYGMITGGKDGLLVRMNPKFEVDASMTTPSGIKSLDISDTGKILVGFEGSELVEVLELTGKGMSLDKKVARTLLQGHRVSSNQELRGCATNPTNEHEYATVGDDSAVYVRNLKTKLTVAKTYLQGKLRAIHYSPDGKYLAVGNNNGDIFILKSNDLTQVHFQKYEKMKDMKTKAHGINVLKFSPNGKFLAVGTNDSVIYVWQLSEGFKKMDTLKGHTAVVNYLDWSSHSDHLRSDSGAEVIHWAIPGGSAVKDIKSVEWTSFTCPFNEMNAKDATKNCVDRSPSKTFTVAGDDSSCLTLQAHPSKPAMPYKRYYGHGGAVTSVAFNSNGKYLLSTGSLDGCTFEWKIQKP